MDSDESELNCMELLDVFSSDCTEVVQGEILRIKATVGNNTMVGLLDTAASFCFMSMQAAMFSKIKFSNDDTLPRVGTFSKISNKAIGVAHNVTKKVFTSCVKIKVIILDCKYDLILGIPWFEAVNASIKFGMNKSRVLSLGKDVFSIKMASTSRDDSEICNMSKKFKQDDEIEQESKHDDMDYGKVNYQVTKNEEFKKENKQEEAKYPKNVKELRLFLDWAKYYEEFVKDYESIT